MRVEINTVLVGLDFYLSVQHPRAMAKEDSASLWDFYTFILLNLLEHTSTDAPLTYFLLYTIAI